MFLLVLTIILLLPKLAKPWLAKMSIAIAISDFIYLYDGVGYYIKIVKDKTAELEKLKKERNRIDDEINKLNEE